MQNQTKITIIVTILLVILLGGYIYKDISSKQINEENTSTSTPEFINKTDGDAQIDFKYADDIDNLDNLDGVAVDIKPVAEKKLPPAPNLNKAIVFNVDVSEEQKIKITNKINQIIANLKENPKSTEDWIELGSNRKLIADFEGVVEAWKYASIISPLNTVPLNNLGNLYHYDLKDYQKAEEYFRKAVEISPNYINSYINLFDLYTLSYKQNTDSAEKILLEGLQNIPNQINLLITLATYYKEKGDNKNAVIYYEKTATEAQKTGNTALYSELQNQINLLR